MQKLAVSWPSVLEHWNQVLVAKSSGWGFESLSWHLSISKTLNCNCFSSPRSKRVPVRAEIVVIDLA